MKTYETKVEFVKTYKVRAKNAAEANGKLMDKIGQDEFALGVDGDYREVEDEPISCLYCDGECMDPFNPGECPQCKGEGEFTPPEYFDDENQTSQN